MCRLFGLQANRPVDVAFSLLTGPTPFRKYGAYNPDGWGIGWYSNGSPIVEKEPVSAPDSELYPPTITNVLSRTVITHVRYATKGARTRENCHPFVFGSWLFAHNGGLNRETLHSALCDNSLEGQTDSEVFFRWIIQNVAQQGDFTRGLRYAIQGVPQDYTSLNFLLSDGERLYAYRNASRDHNRYSLYYLLRDPGQQQQELHSKEVAVLLQSKLMRQERAILVCSEKLTDESWIPIPLGHLLVVDSNLTLRLITV